MTTWELKGKQFGGLRLDDYTVSTRIDVHCDGFGVRILKTATDAAQLRIYDPTLSTLWFYGTTKINDGSYSYYLGYDDTRTTEIIENTPSRVKIRIKGRLDRSSGATGNYLANLTSVQVIYTIYSDRVHVEFEYVASGTVTVSEMFYYDMNGQAGITNANAVYENSGVESDCSLLTVYDSADYLATVSDQCNHIMVRLYDSGSIFETRCESDKEVNMYNTTDVTVGTYTGASVHTYDTESRIGGKRYDSPTKRMAHADDLLDFVPIATLLTGTKVTDLNVPDTLGSDCVTVDGPANLLHDNQVAKFNLDIGRTLFKSVIHDWPFLSGSTPDDHLINHLRCDDSTSNSDVLAVVGTKGNWEQISDGANRNTSNDSVLGTKGNALDTVSAAYYIDMSVAEHTNATLKKGAFLITFKPQFAWDVAAGAYPTIYSLGYDDNNRISLYYNSSADDLTFRIGFGGTVVEIDTKTFTANNEKELQQWHTALCAWDYDQDYMIFILDGVVQGAKYSGWTSVTSNAPGYQLVGCHTGRTFPGDIIIDEIKIFNAPIITHGAFYTGKDQITNMDDDFTGADSSSPSSKWGITKQSTNETCDIQSNELNMQLPTGSGNERVTAKSTSYLSGDFEIMVDWNMPTWPSASSYGANMEFAVMNVGNSYQYSIGRTYDSPGSNRVKARENDPGYTLRANSVLANTTGQFRMVRSGSSLKVFYRTTSSTWTELYDWTAFGTQDCYVLFIASDPVCADAVTVRWDNFVVMSDDDSHTDTF
jgi:hypothetical protein